MFNTNTVESTSKGFDIDRSSCRLYSVIDISESRKKTKSLRALLITRGNWHTQILGYTFLAESPLPMAWLIASTYLFVRFITLLFEDPDPSYK
jgi:hypothetical protein